MERPVLIVKEKPFPDLSPNQTFCAAELAGLATLPEVQDQLRLLSVPQYSDQFTLRRGRSASRRFLAVGVLFPNRERNAFRGPPTESGCRA